MIQLRGTLARVRIPGGFSFGGNQGWLRGKVLKKYACGVIAATDTLLYLAKQNKKDAGEEYSLSVYLEEAEKVRKTALPVIPFFGINGWMLMLGMNLLFRKRKLPFYAFWGCLPHRLADEIRAQLERDIPVVFSIGPHFPRFWARGRLTLYHKDGQNKYTPAVKIHAHYVTATGLDGEWIQISSWGKMYYVNQKEYFCYIREKSGFLVSNMLVIRRKG